MFSGELIDTRTRRQKKVDREREQSKQTEMFSRRDVAQFGVNTQPQLLLSPDTRLPVHPGGSATQSGRCTSE